MGAVDVKWLVLDFTLLWQTALKCVPQTMAYHGILTVDCPEENNCTVDCHEKNNYNSTADCHSQE
jgi:hypothetical protein